MKATKTLKNLKEMPYPPKRKFLKRKGNVITPAKTNAPISQTSSECLKLTIQTCQMKTKNLIMTLGQILEEITKASLPISADLSNDFTQLFWKLTKEKCALYQANFGGAAKISTIFYQ